MKTTQHLKREVRFQEKEKVWKHCCQSWDQFRDQVWLRVKPQAWDQVWFQVIGQAWEEINENS